MAVLTQRLEALLVNRLGSVPDALVTAISPLSAAQRNSFVMAWISASSDQKQQPATSWVLPEEQRDAFDRFRRILLGEFS